MTRKQSFDVKIGDKLTCVNRGSTKDFVVAKISEGYDYSKGRPYRDYFYDKDGHGYFYRNCHNAVE